MRGEGLHFSAFHCFSSTLITKRKKCAAQAASAFS